MELLSETPAADYLDASPLTLRDWRKRGRGPAFVKIGRNVRYRREDLDAYIEARRVDPGATPEELPCRHPEPTPRPPRRPSPTAGRRTRDGADTTASAESPQEARPS